MFAPPTHTHTFTRQIHKHNCRRKAMETDRNSALNLECERSSAFFSCFLVCAYAIGTCGVDSVVLRIWQCMRCSCLWIQSNWYISMSSVLVLSMPNVTYTCNDCCQHTRTPLCHWQYNDVPFGITQPHSQTHTEAPLCNSFEMCVSVYLRTSNWNFMCSVKPKHTPIHAQRTFENKQIHNDTIHAVIECEVSGRQCRETENLLRRISFIQLIPRLPLDHTFYLSIFTICVFVSSFFCWFLLFT